MSAKAKSAEARRAGKSRRVRAAAVLTQEWLASLTHAIESRRGHVRALTDVFPTSEQLALLVAHVVTRPRKDNALPSPLTVAEEIGRLIGAQGEALQTRIGAALLGLAQAAGFVDIGKGKQRAGQNAQHVIALSPAAEAQRDDIEARLAASAVAPERPYLEKPALDIKLRDNMDDIEPAPYPSDPIAIAEALAPIQGTAWRVNRYMLDVLERLPRKYVLNRGALKQAAHYRDAPRFYYACRFDWRGRLYQLGGRLQYTSGDDVARSLLEFADGEPLSPDGRTWLGIHVATCAGIKGSLTDRLVWADEHEREIRAAVEDPLGHLGFWLTGRDEPFAFLAACHAWTLQLKPVHLPVSADGTASGFQHYAWLTRDEALGLLVNLAPGALGAPPSDFYKVLADRMGRARADVKPLAWFVYGKVPRTDSERAVYRELKALPELAALWTLYKALRAAAGRQTKAGKPLEWSLPDGFVVRQANRQSDSRRVELWLHSFGKAQRLQARQRYRLEALDDRGQRDGLPPNLIHSFDACLLRAVVREAQTIDAWAVAHDCLGVHPNRGGELRSAVQQAVAWLYGSDRLAEIKWLEGLSVERRDGLPASMRGGWYTFS